MQVTTAKLCCSDVFFRTFVRSPTIISCFNRTARRLVEESQLLSSCTLQRTVPNFIEPSVWPPNSPDLNPVDYAVWGALQQSIIAFQFPTWTILKTVRACWKSLDQQIIYKSIDQWCSLSEWWTQ